MEGEDDAVEVLQDLIGVGVRAQGVGGKGGGELGAGERPESGTTTGASRSIRVDESPDASAIARRA